MPTHIPVLTSELVSWLRVRPGGTYIDATGGGGGHTQALIQAGAGRMLVLDADPQAAERLEARFAMMGNRVTVLNRNFRELARAAGDAGIGPADGVMFDLGLSSLQLDDSTRGFAFRDGDAPLDMRFDTGGKLTAGDIVNHWPKEELYEIFSLYGEEIHSRSIADAVVGARKLNKLSCAADLNRVIEEGSRSRDEGVKARIYQALRIAVNGELDSLKQALEQVEQLVTPGGRIAVISFHSLEDRMVKLRIRQSGWTDLTGKPVTAGVEEIRRNPRSRSAKLRVAEIKK